MHWSERAPSRKKQKKNDCIFGKTVNKSQRCSHNRFTFGLQNMNRAMVIATLDNGFLLQFELSHLFGFYDNLTAIFHFSLQFFFFVLAALAVQCGLFLFNFSAIVIFLLTHIIWCCYWMLCVCFLVVANCHAFSLFSSSAHARGLLNISFACYRHRFRHRNILRLLRSVSVTVLLFCYFAIASADAF